jgi:hypothetical protein
MTSMTLIASPARPPSAVAAARTVDVTEAYGSGDITLGGFGLATAQEVA